MGLFSKRKPESDPVDPEARSPQLGLTYKDLMLLGQLSAAGAKLGEPRHVIYRLYFPGAEAAALARPGAEAAGFTVELSESDEQCALVAERHGAVLSPDFVRSSDDLFQRLADAHGGEFDGWEASV